MAQARQYPFQKTMKSLLPPAMARRPDRRHLAHKKLLFLTRPPRDVIVSLYAHRVHRDRNWEGPLEAFIDANEGGLSTALRYYQLWNEFLAGHGEAVVLRYEDFHADPAGAFATVLRHLGQPVDEGALNACIEESAFDRLKRMEARSEFRSGRLSARNLDDPQAAKVRRGTVGGFVEDLDPATARAVDQRMESHLRGAFGYRVAQIGAGQEKGESSGAEN